MLNKVMVLSASAGAGHLSAAEALKEAFLLRNKAFGVEHFDTLQYTNKIFRRLYSQAYLDLVNNAPEVLGWLYDFLDKPWENEKRRLAFDRLNTGPFVRLLKKYKPELVVCTHFLPAEIISWLKHREGLATKLSVVITDFDVHAMWLCRQVDRYFVALDETKLHLSELGIPAANISVTGIPIRPAFAENKDKAAMRCKHGLAEDRVNILISAGGFGVGPVEHLMTALLKMRTPAQIVAVCGRSVELEQRLSQIVSRLEPGSPVRVNVVGYTREMDEYMSACDIIVGKPGGLTTSEALAKGMVFVVVNPIPGQEERNSDHLLEMGVAIRCNNLPTLPFKIDELLNDKARFSGMQQRARAAGRPRAAFEIVDELIRVSESIVSPLT